MLVNLPQGFTKNQTEVYTHDRQRIPHYSPPLALK